MEGVGDRVETSLPEAQLSCVVYVKIMSGDLGCTPVVAVGPTPARHAKGSVSGRGSGVGGETPGPQNRKAPAANPDPRNPHCVSSFNASCARSGQVEGTGARRSALGIRKAGEAAAARPLAPLYLICYFYMFSMPVASGKRRPG